MDVGCMWVHTWTNLLALHHKSTSSILSFLYSLHLKCHLLKIFLCAQTNQYLFNFICYFSYVEKESQISQYSADLTPISVLSFTILQPFKKLKNEVFGVHLEGDTKEWAKLAHFTKMSSLQRFKSLTVFYSFTNTRTNTQ